MEVKQEEQQNVIFKKSHTKSKIALHTLNEMLANEQSIGNLLNGREDIVILQVMPIGKRLSALIEYVKAEDF